MDGVDVAGYQDGINTHSLTADFVIIKATEGTPRHLSREGGDAR